jgi:hypothetical protein
VAPGTFFFKESGKSGRASLPIAMAGLNSGEVRPSLSSQRTAFSRPWRGTRSSTMFRPISTN